MSGLLRNVKSRFLATGSAVAALTIAPTALSVLVPQLTSFTPEQTLTTVASSILAAATPAFAAVVSNIALDIFAGDFRDKLREARLYEKIPKDVNLEYTTLTAFRTILSEEIKNVTDKESQKQIQYFINIQLPDWQRLFLNEENDNSARKIITDSLKKLQDGQLIEQFTKKNGWHEANFLTIGDWKKILYQLQTQQNKFIKFDAYEKILNSLHRKFPECLQKVLSRHADTFRYFEMELFKVIFNDLQEVKNKLNQLSDESSVNTKNIISILSDRIEISNDRISDDIKDIKKILEEILASQSQRKTSRDFRLHLPDKSIPSGIYQVSRKIEGGGEKKHQLLKIIIDDNQMIVHCTEWQSTGELIGTRFSGRFVKHNDPESPKGLGTHDLTWNGTEFTGSVQFDYPEWGSDDLVWRPIE